MWPEISYRWAAKVSQKGEVGKTLDDGNSTQTHLKPKSPFLKACLFLLNSMVFLFSSADNLLEVYRCLHRLYKWSIVLLIYRSDYKIAPHHIWDIAILPLLPCLPYSLFLSGKLNGLPLRLAVSLVMRGLKVGRLWGSTLMSSLCLITLDIGYVEIHHETVTDLKTWVELEMMAQQYGTALTFTLALVSIN
jgi:hypothetical protein